jgi:GNAT superfamily N-acetyltransferase
VPTFLQFVPVTVLNVCQSYKISKSIFPDDSFQLKLSFVASLVPKPLLPAVSHAFTAVRLKFLDYYAGVDETGEIVGITGLYAVTGRKEAWIGWFGVAPSRRGNSYGSEILNWTIEAAKQRDFDMLRLWTSTSDDHARAAVMYAARGFVRQDLGVTYSACRQTRLVLYSLGLNGKPPHPFKGALREALLGAPTGVISKRPDAFHRIRDSSMTPEQAL